MNYALFCLSVQSYKIKCYKCKKIHLVFIGNVKYLLFLHSGMWYVMKHLEMNRFKHWLETKNIERLDKGMAVIKPFYPYDNLLPQRTHHNPNAEAPVSHLDFHDILFLNGTEEEVKELVDDPWNKSFRMQLRYYIDTMTGKPAKVAEPVMDDFFANCIKYRGRFELCPSINDIESKDKVEIKKGLFSGHQASVVSVRHSKGELNLELAVELVSGIIYIKMLNVKAHEIAILNKDATSAIRNDFIEYTQNNLLTIYKHRVMAVNDAETRRKDIKMLSRLIRYRAYKVENHAAKAHFTALMLICAHLLKNADEETELRNNVLLLLDEINLQSESKACTDSRTYLWIALYISTNDPVYRDACKDYLRTKQPKSKKLREFIRLMRKGKKA